MTRTLGTVLREREATFVGRHAERSFLRRLHDDDGPAIVFLHGLAGIGKSSLLRAFVREADVPVALVDGELIEPTGAGFLRGLSEAVATDSPTVAHAVMQLGGLGEQVILAVDGYERLGLLDDWLRRILVPSLPPHARVVIVGRDAPVAAWARLYGSLVQAREIDALPPADALALLERRGVPTRRAVAINRMLHGHPLSLQIAASIDASTGETALQVAVDELTRTYLRHLSASTRTALDAASVVRRVTAGLLDAMLGSEAAGAPDRLLELPFVRTVCDGLAVHPVIRAAVAAELKATDPARYRRLRAAAWRRLRDEAAVAGDGDLWRYTADMLYLLDTPAVRDAFFPPSAPAYAVEPAGADDGRAIAAIAERHEPPAGAALQELWWKFARDAFFVARDDTGTVVAFSAVCQPADLPARVAAEDPIVTRWKADLRRRPLQPDQRALFIRFMCGAAGGERPAPDVASLFLDLKRTYLALRPALRRAYTCAHDPAMAATIEPLGFAALDAEVSLDGVVYQCFRNDFGPGSVDGWLARLAARDVLAGSAPSLDPDRRQLTIDGVAVELTPLEFRVLSVLHDRAGAVVRRETLLTEVWGGRWDGEGNALDSAMSGLRRKLGARAGALETVRGLGYRLRPFD